MKYPKRSQYKYTKKAYRVRNWRAYEEGLHWRGDLTIWLSEEAIKAWKTPASAKPGDQRVYANIAIETALTIRLVYHLALRQTEGFLRSLASQLELDLPIPDHTTLSRRARKLGKIRFAPAASSRPIHILIDSTGLKIHVGNLRKPPKYRDWRKLHVAVNALTGEAIACDVVVLTLDLVPVSTGGWRWLTRDGLHRVEPSERRAGGSAAGSCPEIAAIPHDCRLALSAALSRSGWRPPRRNASAASHRHAAHTDGLKA